MKGKIVKLKEAMQHHRNIKRGFTYLAEKFLALCHFLAQKQYCCLHLWGFDYRNKLEDRPHMLAVKDGKWKKEKEKENS